MNFLPSLSRLSTLPSQVLESHALGAVRFKMVKASGGAKWQGAGSPIKKYRGLKKKDGEIATAGTVLATQLSLRFMPGLNAGLGRNGSIFAIRTGKVVISTERVRPNRDHSFIQRLLPKVPDDVPIYKKYINIITEPQHNRFLLVETV